VPSTSQPAPGTTDHPSVAPGAAARRRPSRLTLYAGGTGLAGLALVAVLLATAPPWASLSAYPLPLVALALGLALGEVWPIPVSRGDDSVSPVTISTTFAVALVVLGPLSWLLLVHTVAVALDDARSGRRPIQVLFNAGQYAISLVLARGAFSLLSGDPFLGPYQHFQVVDLVPALLAGAVFVLVNDSLVGVVVALASGQRVSAMLHEDVRFKLETSGVLVALGPLAALVVDVSVLLLPLLVVPVVAVRRTTHLAVLRERQSLHDPLTGLANRELFRRRVERGLDAPGGADQHLALLMVDMDHFKDVNDTLGHHVGDELLRRVAGRIDRAVKAGLGGTDGEDGVTTVARLGGDEFAVLLRSEDPVRDAEELAERVLAVLARPVDVHGQVLSVHCSIGITAPRGRTVDVHTLLSEADIALYEAKRERARWWVFTPGTVTGSAERLALLPGLREAIEADRLEVLFQPQLDVATGRFLTVEALVRWQHPVHGLLGPDQFIGLAESAGLIRPLTLRVLELALEAASGWRRQGWDVGVAVNLSARQLTDHSLPTHLTERLAHWRLPPSRLVVEVTESSLMDVHQAGSVLRALRDIGIRLSIDDFGTGYSSLVRLQRLDVDELKIDKSFVGGLLRGGNDEILVRSIVELAHNLGLQVVAEGVETEEVAEHLRLLGCDRLQGYLLGRPMHHEAVTALLAAQHVRRRTDPPAPPARRPEPVPALRVVGGRAGGEDLC
jgi:diguanylate cyclase (GGDEF)-like protein